MYGIERLWAMRATVIYGLMACVMLMLAPSAAEAVADVWQINGAPYSNQRWQTGNWYNNSGGGAAPPDVEDLVYIHYQRWVYVDTTEAIGELRMYSSGPSVLSITNGGTLTASSSGGRSGTIVLSGAGTGGPGPDPNTGVIDIHTGGTLTSSNTGLRTVLTGDSSQFGDLNLKGGTFNAEGSTGADVLSLLNVRINLNSGTFNMTGGQIHIGNGGAIEVNINGDQTTITMDDLNASDPLAGGDFNFNMDSDGVSTITDAGTTHLKNIDIVVDGANYTGGPGTFTLFSAGTLGSLPNNAPQAVNFPAGRPITFGQMGNDYVMTILPIGTIIHIL